MVQGPSLLLATDCRVLMRNVASTVAPIILVSSGSDTVSKGCSWCMHDVTLNMAVVCYPVGRLQPIALEDLLQINTPSRLCWVPMA